MWRWLRPRDICGHDAARRRRENHHDQTDGTRGYRRRRFSRPRHAPANTPGIRHVAFAIEDIDAVVTDLRAHGAELVGELERYEDSYWPCYVHDRKGSSSN
jgi:Glyoxalase/Bleomycin resistance protein/Dioxygenase superfamily